MSKISVPGKITLSPYGTGNIGLDKLPNASSAFSPANISGIQLWLKADSLSLNDNDLVTTWTDSSGNGNNATASNKPTYKTNQINGLPAVQFIALDFMQTPSITMTNMSIFIVLKPGATAGYVMEFAGAGSSNAIISNFTANTLEVFNSPRISMGATATTAFSQHTLTRDATNGTKTWRNGSAVTTDPSAVTPNTGVITIGTDGGAGTTDQWSGYIAEIILYNNEVSSANRALIESYLLTKYGL